jgi:hypothetical protein
MAELAGRSERESEALIEAFREVPALGAIGPGDLVAIGLTGMAHDHLLIRSRGLVLRIPRISQWELPAEVNLAYQIACYRRAQPSGHTPELVAVLAPSAALPMGALIVRAIDGRKPKLPQDLGAIAACLAAIHRLPVPIPEARRPLLSPPRSLSHIMETIGRQAEYLERARLAPAATALIRKEFAWAADFAAAHAETPEPKALIVTDSHPGNFLIDGTGKAHFVDLEKAMYALPAIDLAHATLYTSTRFDPDVDSVLTEETTRAFYRSYLGAVEPALAQALRPWHAPMRRLVWLRTVTWCIRWQVFSQGADGWSRLRLEPRVRAHMEACLADYFEPATIARIRDELSAKDAGERLAALAG